MRKNAITRIAFLSVAVVALAAFVAESTLASGDSKVEADLTFGIGIPPG